jgi:HPt (histidine-containing phosphotransfer) domain-containing protein
MDCQMPILDGLDTTREIHRWQSSAFASHRRPVVIAMTANAMKEDRQMCLDAGMDDYLSKPVMKEKLAAALEYWASVILKIQDTDASEQIESSIKTDTFDLPIDWEHLHQLSENNAEFELELLQLFVEDSQSHLEAVKIAIATHDFQQLLKESHHLKGASANVGATTMQQAAEKLEKLGYNQELQDTDKLVQDLENFLHLIQVYLIGKLLN